MKRVPLNMVVKHGYHFYKLVIPWKSNWKSVIPNQNTLLKWEMKMGSWGVGWGGVGQGRGGAG